jgi:hypothetical protein
MLSPSAQRDAVRPTKRSPDDEGLREAVRTGLAGVGNRQASSTAVPEQTPKSVLFVRRGDHQMSRMPASISVDSG